MTDKSLFSVLEVPTTFSFLDKRIAFSFSNNHLKAITATLSKVVMSSSQADEYSFLTSDDILDTLIPSPDPLI